jgi:hypothetical protein
LHVQKLPFAAVQADRVACMNDSSPLPRFTIVILSEAKDLSPELCSLPERSFGRCPQDDQKKRVFIAMTCGVALRRRAADIYAFKPVNYDFSQWNPT